MFFNLQFHIIPCRVRDRTDGGYESEKDLF